MTIADFDAAVYHGADTGLSLRGRVVLTQDASGRLAGSLIPKTGLPVPVSGQLTGVAVTLVFYLGTGRHLIGTGAFGRDTGAKAWFVGGSLVGPRRGDSGEWAGLLQSGTLAPPPAVVAVTPNVGPTSGGTLITIFGQNFQPGTIARLGGVPMNVQYLSSNQISAVTPAEAAGPANLRVINPDGQAAVLSGAFTFR